MTVDVQEPRARETSAFHVDADTRLLTAAEAATIAGVAHSTVRRWIHEQRLPAVRHAGRTYVPEADLLDLEWTLRTAGQGRPRRLHALSS